MEYKIVSHAEWVEARQRLLAKERELTHRRDALARERRELPWERVEKRYVFEGPAGKETLAELFGPHSQLIVYHFMYGPDWGEPCKSCSFWADNFERIDVHLAHRDVSFVAVSRAEYPKLEAQQRRFGWTFKWVSSFDSDFNYDFDVSFRPADLAKGPVVSSVRTEPVTIDEQVGVSVFAKDPSGAVFHTYSTYNRGVDLLNGAYQYLDLAPKGRDEDGLPYTMAWLRHRDRYED
ncbi:MAG TPA: thioredoxin family protein [Myxococcota bacterium]|nr:thioredoxin family protein [Myxococcota bacterium]